MAKFFGAEGHYETVPISGVRGYRADDWLVCASTGIEGSLVHDLEPFSTEREMGLPPMGEVPTERCAVGPTAAWSKGQDSLRRYEYRQSQADARLKGELSSEQPDLVLAGKVSFGQPVGKAVWLPLYVLSVHTGKGSAQVVVNGESGKVASRVPYSWAKVAPVGFAATGVLIASAGTLVPFVAAWAAWTWFSGREQRKRNEANFLTEG